MLARLRRQNFIAPLNKGFTNLEMAIVITIASLVLFAIIQFVNPALAVSRLNASRSNMQHVVQVLSVYAQHNNRIPCPADPNTADGAQPPGMEVGSGASGVTVPDVLGQGGCMKGGVLFNEGIVPYATLGIARTDVIDGWGDYLTYHVNPTFAQDPSPAAVTVALAHARCRIPRQWVTGGGTLASSAANRDGPKARFCCPGVTLIGSDISVRDATGANLWTYTRDASANYDAVDTPTPLTTINPVTNNATAIAFVLVSHGPNRAGAFLDDGARVGADANMGNGELENMNGNNTFVSAPQNDVLGASHFDDIVMWRTQDDLYSAMGHLSCQMP